MKVLDLRCAAGHGFEGWFASEDDYGTQRDRGLLDCPVCGNADIARMPSAPRLNLSGAREREPAAATGAGTASAPAGAPAQGAVEVAAHGEPGARFAEAVAQLLSQCEDVGTRFAEEARRIHYGEREAGAIRGRTTPAEREALAEEGIEVLTLPVPVDKGTLQ